MKKNIIYKIYEKILKFTIKTINWFKNSNRYKHLIYSIPISSIFNIFGFMFILGLATGMEFKDKLWGGKWDWIDWLMTIFGGIIGVIINTLLINIIK